MRPDQADLKVRTTTERAVLDRLTSLGIAYERFEHPPVPTVEQAEKHWAGIDAAHCKNLFLRNQKGNRHYLVIIAHTQDLESVFAFWGAMLISAIPSMFPTLTSR